MATKVVRRAMGNIPFATVAAFPYLLRKYLRTAEEYYSTNLIPEGAPTLSGKLRHGSTFFARTHNPGLRKNGRSGQKMPNFYAHQRKVDRRFAPIVVASVGGTYKGSETLKARRLAKGIGNRGVCLSCLHFHAVSGHFGCEGIHLADVLLAALQVAQQRHSKALATGL